MLTVSDMIAKLPSPSIPRLPVPPYHPPSIHWEDSLRVGLAVESMKDHMTNEGYEIFAGLENAGYALAGYKLTFNNCDVPSILAHLKPTTLVMQDKREWDVTLRDFREPRARFHNVQCLKSRHDIFKLTILKDSHQNPIYHRESADEINSHGWIIYYHPRIVYHLAPYVRPEHLVRTYHSVNSPLVRDAILLQEISKRDRGGCLLSGAISGVYPLRQRLVRELSLLYQTTYLPHPGYHRRGCHTPEFYKTLTRFKVAICTASVYGYALRKIIEATACGCLVITDLPHDEILPHIDANLVRVPPDISTREMAVLINNCIESYDEDRQQHFSKLAVAHYDYRVLGQKLADDIEKMATSFTNPTNHHK